MTKRFLMAASAAVGLLAAASSASAVPLTSGTITLNGTVNTSCSVTGGITGSHTVDPMAAANGAIDPSLSGTTLASPRTTDDFTVTCSGANLLVQVSANQMTNTTTPNVAPAGYADKVRFTATARALAVTAPAVNSTVDVTDAVSTDATAVSGALGPGAFFRAPTAANLSVYTYAYNTNGNTSDILTAGAYQGTVVVTIATNP